MGLWLKKDGEFIPVSGGSAGGGEVLTGDPSNPPEDWAAGQLLYDGVEDGGGDAGGSIQYHSIGTTAVTGIGATEVDLPIVDVYGGPLVVGQRYVVSTEGSFRFGVGATSFVHQTVNINGSSAVDGLVYKTFIDNERFVVSASRQWNCDDANPTVTVVASTSAGSMQTFNEGTRRANVTFTPIQPSGGGGGAAGPHDHDYLPLEGGTLTGDLVLDGGTLNASGGSHVLSGGNQVLRLMNSAPDSRPYVSVWFDDVRAGFFGNPSASSGGITEVSGEGNTLKLSSLVQVQVTSDLQVDGLIDGQLGPVPDDFWAKHDNGLVFNGAGIVSGSLGSWRQSMTCNGYRNSGNKWTSMAVNGDVGAAALELTPNGHFYVRAASSYPTGSASVPPLRFQVTESTTTVFNTFNPVGGTAFGITEGIDTADVLDRAEVATMPALDAEGVATTDAEVESITVNEVVTALLLKVKELSARIETLEGN